MLVRLLAMSLVVVIAAATMFPHCDFDDSDCDSIRIVAEAQANPGILADRTAPDRAKAGGGDDGGATGPDLPDGASGAWWGANPAQAAARPDPTARTAWYPPWTIPEPASLAGPPPVHPPQA